MRNIISFIPRSIAPTKPTLNNVPNEKKVEEFFFPEDFENLKLLDSFTIPADFVKIPTLFYPGPGADILFPLHYVEKLFPMQKTFKFHFMDLDNNLENIKTTLHDVGITFSQNKNSVEFYWKTQKIILQYDVADVFHKNTKIPSFDIYFEKAFGIMKDPHEWYEQFIVNKLKSRGILISDNGFQSSSLETFDVPKKLSSYEEMIIGRKK